MQNKHFEARPALRLVLFEPDIPQNAGTLMRLAAGLGVALDLIEPCGFVLDDRRLRRAGMDYLDHLDWTRHSSWAAYRAAPQGGRLVLLTTRAAIPYTDFRFAPGDRLLVGRESAGVPDEVHDAADARLVIPMVPPARSLNVAVSAAMVLGEALRQTAAWDGRQSAALRSDATAQPETP
ncbi:tRNA (cytidine(34)-2'-O)-methyltransferase [Azospirillum palustre]